MTTTTRFSVLVTNSRNGGQHELTIDAVSVEQVIRLLGLTRPHYIIKRIAATCNARDFYPQGDGAYQQARKERDEAFRKLKEVQDLAEAWIARASGDI